MTEKEIMNLVTELGGLMQAPKDADAADKAEIYRRIGLTLTYHPQETSSSRGATDISLNTEFSLAAGGGARRPGLCEFDGDA